MAEGALRLHLPDHVWAVTGKILKRNHFDFENEIKLYTVYVLYIYYLNVHLHLSGYICVCIYNNIKKVTGCTDATFPYQYRKLYSPPECILFNHT